MKEIKKYVLVIDDDLDILVFCEKILTNTGSIVLRASNIAEALAKVEEYAPHIILLDLKLNEESGFSFLDELTKRDILQHIHVYIISGDQSKDSILQSRKYGVKGYLVKPFSNNSLVNIMRSYNRSCGLPEILPSEEKQKIKVFVPAEIIKFNEISFVIRSRIKFMSTEKLEIESSFFKELNVKNGHFKIYQKSRDINPGIYDTVLRLIGLPESTLQLLRQKQKRRV